MSSGFSGLDQVLASNPRGRLISIQWTKVYGSNFKKPHFAPSHRGKAKQSQLGTRMKQIMHFIQKQIPCQNLVYFVVDFVN